MYQVIRLDRLLSNRGYCSRREVRALLREQRVTSRTNIELKTDSNVNPDDILVDGQALDPESGMVVCLNKPIGYTCSHAEDAEALVYDLLPQRWLERRPRIETIGRLDKDTSGVLLLTDDGKLLHRLISPKHRVAKVYRATLARPLPDDAEKIFASGELLLENDNKPLLPAELKPLQPCQVEITVYEGRYHMVRRMVAALGSHVESLERVRFGSITLDGLAQAQYRLLSIAERAAL